MKIGYKYTEPDEYEMPECPKCGSDTNDLYQGEQGEILGCPNCVDIISAFDWRKERDENAYLDRMGV